MRGQYHDDESLALLAPGGLPALFDDIFLGAGMVATDDPQMGDIALILPIDDVPRGAIRTEAGYVTIAGQGIWGVRMNVRRLKAWTFP